MREGLSAVRNSSISREDDKVEAKKAKARKHKKLGGGQTKDTQLMC